ncbi:type II toxin-antitoxin system Phd/YefM family antitoxin [Streptococcus iniae]|nr:prevent-host-death protein [Streptococcus iniae]
MSFKTDYTTQSSVYFYSIHPEFEPLIVVNKNPDENIVVLSQESWESLQETIRVMENDYLSHKVIDGMLQVKEKQVVRHHLIEVEDV